MTLSLFGLASSILRKSLLGMALGVCVLLASSIAFAQSTTAHGGQKTQRESPATVGVITPGEYVAGGGWGTLVIKPEKKPGVMPFALDTLGPNGHTCGLGGELFATGSIGRAKVPTDEPGEFCEVTFTKMASGAIDVDNDSSGACRHFCGMRGRFDNRFLVPEPGCGTSALSSRRKAFLSAYKNKSYQHAYEQLAPLVTLCHATLHEFEGNNMINDLALTLYRLGRKDECLKVLEPLIELARTPDRKIDGLPSDADARRRHARAARTNLKLCGYPLHSKQKS